MNVKNLPLSNHMRKPFNYDRYFSRRVNNSNQRIYDLSFLQDRLKDSDLREPTLVPMPPIVKASTPLWPFASFRECRSDRRAILVN